MNTFHTKVRSIVLKDLLKQAKPVDYQLEARGAKVTAKHLRIITSETILALAQKNKLDFCYQNGIKYIYNGCYWEALDPDEVTNFLREASLRMGVNQFDAKAVEFQAKLANQFALDILNSKPDVPEDITLINVKNGTLELGLNGIKRREFRSGDFLKYQLPFDYDPMANCPMFMEYLNTVLPDEQAQKVLGEYIGYLFIRPNQLKLEKALLLHGSGANGKSVFFEIINALLGGDANVSSYSLASLASDKNYCRAKIADKLVNYATELSSSFEIASFKQLVSGEPLEARLPYEHPFMLKGYAKMVFNTNELPTLVEHNDAFFRRLLIIPFEVTIPENKRDPELASKIINAELSGVMNWVITNMNRLLKNRKFTKSDAVEKRVADFRKESDSVQLFLDDKNYVPDLNSLLSLESMYQEFKTFCSSDGYRTLSKKRFSERLQAVGYEKKREHIGTMFYATKKAF